MLQYSLNMLIFAENIEISYFLIEYNIKHFYWPDTSSPKYKTCIWKTQAMLDCDLMFKSQL